MAITWKQRPTGIKVGTNPESITLPFLLTGTTSETTARALALGYSSVLYDSLYRGSIQVEHLGRDLWNVDVTYGPMQKKEPKEGDFKWAFDTTGGTKHITNGISHVSTYPASGAPHDHKGAINVKEGDVEGVDIPDAAFKWTETWQLLLANYGFTYSSILGDYSGMMNSAPFRGKPARTVKFGGGVGGQSIKDPRLLEVAFHFEYSRPGTDLVVDDITGIQKAGWDYLWIRYDPREDRTVPAKPKSIMKPVQVEVERVLYEFDFALLGIGTAPL